MSRHEKTPVKTAGQEALADFQQKPGEARTLAHQGEAAYLLGCYDEALADLNRAIELKPDYAWALARRGETYRLMKWYAEALADLNLAIELKPDYAWAIAHRGATYRAMRLAEQALADLNLAVALKADYAWALVHRAETYIMLRRYEEALTDADQVIALDQTLVHHWQGERGLLLNYLQRYAETVSCCEQALQQDPNDPIALYSFAVALACWHGVPSTQDILSKTEALLQSLVETEASAGILYRLGGLAALQDKTEQALIYFEKAVALDDEPVEMARHDPVWLHLRHDSRFQALIELEQKVDNNVQQC